MDEVESNYVVKYIDDTENPDVLYDWLIKPGNVRIKYSNGHQFEGFHF
jgi:hypothetical protein